jgi:hypothetical protein
VALAQASNGGPVDTVQAVVGYEGGATSSSFHTFAHAHAGELQSIVFGWDWAVAELHGWIALDLRLEGLLSSAAVELLEERLATREALLALPGEPPLPDASLTWRVAERFPGGRAMRAHGQARHVDARVVLEASLGGPAAKRLVYEQSVRAGLAALLAAVEDGQGWVINAADLWSSMVVAVAAREAAASGRMVTCLQDARGHELGRAAGTPRAGTW